MKSWIGCTPSVAGMVATLRYPRLGTESRTTSKKQCSSVSGGDQSCPGSSASGLRIGRASSGKLATKKSDVVLPVLLGQSRPDDGKRDEMRSPERDPTRLELSPSLQLTVARVPKDIVAQVDRLLKSRSSTRMVGWCASFSCQAAASMKALVVALTKDIAAGRHPATSNMPSGAPLDRYVAEYDFVRPMTAMCKFLHMYLPEDDVLSIVTGTLVFLRRLNIQKSRGLIGQMLVWFDVSNCLFFLGFLAQAWLLDTCVSLKQWSHISEGICQRENMGKCVRNLLKIKSYRLYIAPDEFSACRSALLRETRP
mmetsp:Transcript_8205/g.17926  ORF Transcript_8205/g.17926 Transcript_8205/m.17926 type:complete len:310 (+) Transcript_8205:1-930(+)